MSRGRYPNWVRQFVGENQKAKRVNGCYYLYGVDGGREIYLGVITKEGVRYKQEERLSVGSWSVYEYGASRILLELCPSAWKEQRGSHWRDDLLSILSEVTPTSYLLREGVPEPRGNIHLAKKNLVLLLRKHYQTSIDEILATCSRVMLLVNRETGEKSLSELPEKALALAERLGVQMEVLL